MRTSTLCLLFVATTAHAAPDAAAPAPAPGVTAPAPAPAAIVASPAASAAPAALTVAGWARALQAPVLAAASADASGRTLTLGHLELKLASGRLRPVLAAGRTVGAFFTGSGTFRYVSLDPVEAVTYRGNSKRASPYAVDAEGGVGDGFESALVLSASGAETLVTGELAHGEADAATRLRFEKHLAEWRADQGVGYAQLLPQAIVAGPPDAVQVAEIDAGRAQVLWISDGLRDGDESLSVLRATASGEAIMAGRKYRDRLSAQPIRRPRLEPRPVPYRLVDVDVTLINAGEAHAEVTARETFEVLAPLRVLALDLATTFVGQTGSRARWIAPRTGSTR